MKKFIIIILVISAFGCEDFLDEKSLENYTLDNFYQSVGQLEIGINGMFWTLTRIPQATDWTAYTEGVPGYLTYPIQGDRTHHFISCNINNMEGWINWEGIWYWFYQGIEQANVAVSRLNSIPTDSEAEEEMLKVLSGEVYFLRGFFFWDAVQLFGEIIPLKTEPTFGLEGSVIPPAKEGEIFAQIESDWKMAIENLPDKSYLDQGSRPYKALAQAYLAKLYLRRGQLTNNQSDFDEAAKLAAEVITSDKVGLYENIDVGSLDPGLQASSRYPSLDALHSITWERGKERMFVANIVENVRQSGDYKVGICSFPPDLLYWGGKTTKAQVDIIGDGPVWWNNPEIIPVEEMLKIGTQYPWDNRFKNRGWIYTSIVNEQGDSIVIGEGVPKITAAIYRFFDENIMFHSGEFRYRAPALDYALMRYPDVIFDYAEAVAMGGGKVNGVDPIFHLNKVRNRGGEGNAVSVPQLSGPVTLDMVVEERFRETVYDGHSLFDISRTKRAVEISLDGTIVVKPYTDAVRAVFRANNQLITPEISVPEFLSEKDFYLPIPMNELLNNPYLSK